MEKNETKQMEITAKVEALLFSYGEPLEIKRIAKILNKKEEEIKKAIQEIEDNLKAENRGIRIIKSEDKIQLATKPEFYSILEGIIKEEFKEQLTPASLETLALVAYLHPISRPQLDYYRGVNSSFILRSLLVRGLVEKFPDPQRPSFVLYRPSFDLIKYLGISSIEEMPEFEKFREILKSGLTENNSTESAQPISA